MPNRTTMLAGLPGLVLVLAASPGLAAERTVALSGAGLAVDTPCAATVEIQPDPGLQGRSVVTAAADNQQELDRLVFEDTQGGPRISTGRRECWQPAFGVSFTRTLKLSVRVPAGSPLSIAEAGAGRYTLGDVGGPLTVGVSGAAQIGSGRMTTLKADLSGAGSLAIAALDGPATVAISGHGEVTVATATIPKLSVDLSGVGSFTLKAGQVGSATLNDSGAGSIRIGGQIGDVATDVSGIGSVHLGRVTGTLHKDVSGLRSVTTGD